MFLRTAEMTQYVEQLEECDKHAQIKFNHEDCPAGTDTKQRLYVKYVGSGWVFFCHHCGSKGYLREVERTHRPSELMADGARTFIPTPALLASLQDNELTVPMTEWSSEARLWWSSYELDAAHAAYYHTQWDGKRLWLWAGAAGYQGRGFNTTPKYVTIRGGNDKAFFFLYNYRENNEVFIVEDLVSAYKLDSSGANVICLQGTKLNDQHKNLCFRFGRVMVWLDEDIAGQTAATEIKKQLNALTDVRNICHKQPKEICFADLKEIVLDA